MQESASCSPVPHCNTMSFLILLLIFVPVLNDLVGPEIVTSELGESVTITCRYRTSSVNVRGRKFWCKFSKTQPGCITIISSTPFMARGYKDRMRLVDSPRDGIFQVEMANLTREDTGMYRCGIGQSNNGFIFNVYLSISEGLNLTDQSHMVSGELRGSVTVRCTFHNESASDRKYWCKMRKLGDCYTIADTEGHVAKRYKGRVLITPGENLGSFKILINQLVPEDAGWYRCGTGTFGRGGTWKDVEMQVSTDTTVPERAAILHGVPGGSVTAECHNDPQVNYTQKYWCRWRGNECSHLIDDAGSVENATEGRISLMQRDQNNGTYTVLMTDLREEDAGWYWCVATDGHSDLTSSMELRIYKVPRASGPMSEMPTTSAFLRPISTEQNSSVFDRNATGTIDRATVQVPRASGPMSQMPTTSAFLHPISTEQNSSAFDGNATGTIDRATVQVPTASGPMSQMPTASGPMSQMPTASAPMSQMPTASGPMSQMPTAYDFLSHISTEQNSSAFDGNAPRTIDRATVQGSKSSDPEIAVATSSDFLYHSREDTQPPFHRSTKGSFTAEAEMPTASGPMSQMPAASAFLSPISTEQNSSVFDRNATGTIDKAMVQESESSDPEIAVATSSDFLDRSREDTQPPFHRSTRGAFTAEAETSTVPTFVSQPSTKSAVPIPTTRVQSGPPHHRSTISPADGQSAKAPTASAPMSQPSTRSAILIPTTRGQSGPAHHRSTTAAPDGESPKRMTTSLSSAHMDQMAARGGFYEPTSRGHSESPHLGSGLPQPSEIPLGRSSISSALVTASNTFLKPGSLKRERNQLLLVIPGLVLGLLVLFSTAAFILIGARRRRNRARHPVIQRGSHLALEERKMLQETPGEGTTTQCGDQETEIAHEDVSKSLMETVTSTTSTADK